LLARNFGVHYRSEADPPLFFARDTRARERDFVAFFTVFIMRTLTMRPVMLRARYAHVIRRDVRLSASSSQQEYCAALAFDLETTGLDLRTSEVVQIAIVIANSKRGACFVRKVLPEGPIDPGASAVHGFTRESLIADGAAPFATVWKECEDWLDETLRSSTRPLVWAAHNGKRFDFPILTRCVNHVSGGTSALLRPPRARFVDTLTLARESMPRRTSDGHSGSYTLGSLYRAASRGASLVGAHDAMADAQALALVWRWLVEDVGADSTTRDFQNHLQSIGYGLPRASPPPPPRRAATASTAAPRGSVDAGARDGVTTTTTTTTITTPNQGTTEMGTPGTASTSARTRAKPSTSASARAAKKTSESEASVSSVAGGSVTQINGIGPHLARLLESKAIHSYDDLEEAWRLRQSNSQKMVYWLRRSLPGANPLVIAKAVKGMRAEWGGVDGGIEKVA
jgi:DNA polymerase III epsilon subunit-like protein/predicted flap endonuclease-1-like 5' DNA nuclease